MEEGDDDLPIIEDDEFPFDFEEDPEEEIESCTNDKDTTAANSFHPKLVPLLVSMFFMLFNIILVSSFSYSGIITSLENCVRLDLPMKNQENTCDPLGKLIVSIMFRSALSLCVSNIGKVES